MLNTRTYLATAFLAITAVLLSSMISATNLTQFGTLSRDQQAKVLVRAVRKIVSDVAPVNPNLSMAIRNYFEITERGHPIPMGMVAFSSVFLIAEQRVLEGERKRDQVLLEGILLAIVKNDVMPNLQEKAPTLPSVQDELLEKEWKVALAALTDARLEQMGQQERKVHQQMQEADCRTIRLHNGRQVLVGEHGEYVDKNSKQVLHGADAEEARRNAIDLSNPVTLRRYHECLAQYGILDLDITKRKQ